MAVINTNITALIGQKNLTSSASALQTAMTRLSSGLRINSAADDAAGQAIANRMTAQVTGLSQAQRNANDGISVAQTAEGALNQVNDNLQRIRQLAVQAANGTNSTSDLSSIQDEIKLRLDEIDRVSAQTSFNGVNVLASEQKLTIQVGANDGQTISIDLHKITADTLGLASLDMTDQVASSELSNVGTNLTAAVPATTVALTYAGSSSLTGAVLHVDNAGALYATIGASNYTATFDGAAGTISVDTSAALGAAPTAATDETSFIDGSGNVVATATAQASAWVDTAAAATYNVYQIPASGAMYIGNGTDTWTVGAGGTTLNMATGLVTLGTKDAAANTGGTLATSGDILTVPGTAAVAVDMSGITLTGTNTLMKDGDGNYFVKNVNGTDTAYYKATANAATGAVTLGARAVVDPLKALDSALSQVDELRSGLGAMQNRFESSIQNLATATTNLSAARSRIQDADYAVEVSNMTRAQILQQAGTSVLAQANQVPQTVLSLLR